MEFFTKLSHGICRVLGAHMWEPKTIEVLRKNGHRIRRIHWKCRRCLSYRPTDYDGGDAHYRYRLVKGYRLSFRDRPRNQRPTRVNLREDVLNELFKKG